ncbi:MULTISPECIES: EAL domain-containing protein [Synergistaceae]|uniref:EAL domain-containing protein n=1 Tax=Synergistaceae TaxID=649777 RepID=UPI003AEBCD05|nr:EAL domain-containing protein [Synergistaceae bacterium DZ-S4]
MEKFNNAAGVKCNENFSYSNFLNFFHMIKEFLFILNMDGKILQVNRTVLERLGYSEEELYGSSVLLVHPEERREEARRYVEEMLEGKREFCPISLLGRDGSRVPVETRVSRGEWDGKPVLFGVSKDMSDLKLSEEKFSKAFEASGALMAISDEKEGVYIDVNRTFCETLGYAKEEVIGKSSKDLNLFVDYSDRGRVLDNLARNGHVGYAEVSVRCRDGRILTGCFNVEKIYIADRACILTTMNDLTEIKKMEEEIRKYNEQLEILVREEVRQRDLVDHELKNQEHLTDLLFEQPSVGIFFMMLDKPVFWNDSVDKEKVLDYVFEHQKITRVNKAMLEQYRTTTSDFIGKTPNLLFAHNIEHGRNVWKDFFDKGYHEYETDEKRFDGSNMTVKGQYVCIYDKNGRIIGHFGIQSDITESKQTEENLIKYRNELVRISGLYKIVSENIGDIIFVYNVDKFKFTYISPSIYSVLGHSSDDYLVIRIEDIVSPAYRNTVYESIKSSVKKLGEDPESVKNQYFQIKYMHKDGHDVWCETVVSFRRNDEHEVEVLGRIRDITESKKNEEEIDFISFHDMETGLMNRAALRKMEIESDTQGLDSLYSVIHLDIDNFSSVKYYYNDKTLNMILKEFANLIQSETEGKCLLFRYGGDEFILLVPSRDINVLESISEKLFNKISKRIKIGDEVVVLSVSIGAAAAEENMLLSQTIKNASAALYISKKTKNTVTFYEPEMEQIKSREVILQNDLKQAIGRDQFELYYQPIVNIGSPLIDQAEALIRWKHHRYGMISPLDFIPMAERSGMIVPITEWVVNEACRQAAQWRAKGIIDFTVSINMSLVYLEKRRESLVDFMTKTVKEHDILPSNIKIEITESSLTNQPDEVIRTFEELKKEGFELALDDFGTGYSTFSTMLDLPLDVVKLDRSFTLGIEKDEKKQRVAESMINIFNEMGLEVIAEGVETEAQLSYMRKYGCRLIQGYIFSKPLPADKFFDYLKSVKENGIDILQDKDFEVPAEIKIEWRSGCRSGDHQIDRQHRALISSANSIINLLLKDGSRDTILTLLENLNAEISDHFRYEEDVMLKVGFPERERIAEEHKEILKKFDAYLNGYKCPDEKDRSYYFLVLFEDILGHMIKWDRKFFSYTGKTI